LGRVFWPVGGVFSAFFLRSLAFSLAGCFFVFFVASVVVVIVFGGVVCALWSVVSWGAFFACVIVFGVLGSFRRGGGGGRLWLWFLDLAVWWFLFLLVCVFFFCLLAGLVGRVDLGCRLCCLGLGSWVFVCMLTVFFVGFFGVVLPFGCAYFLFGGVLVLVLLS